MKYYNLKFKKIVSLLALLLTFQSANASLLWDINVGINKLKEKDTAFLKEYFKNYIENNPNDKEGYFWLGKIYSQQKDKKSKIEGAKYFKKAYELTSKNKDLEKISFDFGDKTQLEDYFDMAAMFFEIGNTKEAELYADMMLKINSKSPSVYFIKAKVAQMNANEELAKEHLEKAIIFNNDFLKTNLAKKLGITSIPEMSEEMYKLFALESYFSGEIEKSIKYFNKYLEKSPKNVDAMNFLVDLYIKNNQIETARDVLSEIFKINPTNLETLMLQMKINEINNISNEDLLIKIKEIYPNDSRVLLYLGNSYLKAKKYKEAKIIFDTLVLIDDSMYEAYVGHIFASIELNETENFIQYYRKAVALNQNASEPFYLIAKFCVNNGDFFEAESYITEAIKKDENPSYLFELAKINYFLKKHQQSIVSLNDAKKMPYKNFDYSEIDEFLAKNYIKLKDLNSLNSLIESKNQLDKNRILYKYILYNIYKLQGKEKEAKNEFAKIKKSKPENLVDYIDLSEIYLNQKGLEFAIKFLDEAIKKHKFTNQLYAQKLKIKFMAGEKITESDI